MGQRLIFELKEREAVRRLYGSDDGDLEMYVDGIHGFLSSPQHVKFNFYTTVFTGEKGIERREVKCRIVMPLTVFLSVAQFFVDRADEIKKQMSQIVAESSDQELERAKKQKNKRKKRKKSP